MASLVFTAFTLEAYLNHIGPKVLKSWAKPERFGPRKKLKEIAKQLQIVPNYDERPWQVMNQLFGFRNDIAHGKSEVVKDGSNVPIHEFSDDRFGDIVQTDWEKYCTEKNARRAREDVAKIVHALNEAGGFEHDYPFISGFQRRSATVINK